MAEVAYVDASAVVAVLPSMQPDTTLSSAAIAGATQIEIVASAVPNGDLYPGMYLALDQFNPGTRETVQVTGAITGAGPYTVPVTALTNAHAAGAPVKECSGIQGTVLAASRFIDDFTWSKPSAFAEQTWTETVEGNTLDGRLVVSVSGRNVTAVSAFSWVCRPTDDATVVATDQLVFRDFVIEAYPPDVPAWNSAKRLLVAVTYTAGYATAAMPSDIVRAATVMAARLWKEGESGFSDVVGSPDLGALLYKKGVPPDVAAMLMPWRRIV